MVVGSPAESKPSYCCISHEFFKAATKFPDKLAVIQASGLSRIVHDNATTIRLRGGGDDVEVASAETVSSSRPPVYDGDECYTFSDVLSAVESFSFRLRHFLHGLDEPSVVKTRSGQSVQQSSEFRDVRIPKVVGIYMEPSVEYIVAVLSVLRCGEAFMPLDPTWPKARILSILSSSNADLVVGIDSSTMGNHFHRMDTLRWLIDEGNCPVLPVCMKYNTNKQSHPLLSGWPCESEKLRSFCYLIYTSGSSGKPKGVCGTEMGLLNRFSWMQEMYPPDEGDLMLFKTAISFIDHIQEFLGAILSTCTLVIPPFNQLRENIFYLLDFMQRYLINRLVAVPSLMRAIFPSLQSPHYATARASLKLLVLSGEVLHLSLCKMLLKLLPQTLILNLYGCTEVTGDCTYFDCRRLPLILKKEILGSVPIGLPFSNCDVVLVGEGASYEGEIYVGGQCVAAGYFHYPHVIPLAEGSLPQELEIRSRVQHYFQTGDFAKKLTSGDLVFIGRKDRLLKVNGQRIAVEEIESAFREHPDVADAAVLSHEVDGEILLLEAHVVTKQAAEGDDLLRTSLKSWLQSKLPQVMIPSRILFPRSLPSTSSGKVDYFSLAASSASDQKARINVEEIPQDHLVQVIRQVFSEALMVEKVFGDDDFFAIGGNSISAAFVSFKLGIHMSMLYTFPTPAGLQNAMLSSITSGGTDFDLGVNLQKPEQIKFSRELKFPNFHESAHQEWLFKVDRDSSVYNPAKKLKSKSGNHATNLKGQSPRDNLWSPPAMHAACSFSRCNKSTHGGQCEGNYLSDSVWSNIVLREGKGFMWEQWKVEMGSCVDASPLLVCKETNVYLFIGSHSHKFVCVDGRSGVVHWETKLEGRVECSAAILDDFSQVVVGCYQGYIYFLNFSSGRICWSFQTNAEVKSQPVVDTCRHLVWCGSYDHNLYAIDYKSYSCIYRLQCDGSIFGSPAIDEMQDRIYVASTSGHVTALEIKSLPFKILWKQDMGAPVFGSLTINYPDGNIICCLVDGTVVFLSTFGSIAWKARTGGPIFAGPCTSQVLPSQVLICSRDGSIYSFEMGTGNLIWKHVIGRPITASPCVDENSQLISSISTWSNRLICVCDTSGSIHVLRVAPDANGGSVQEFARLDLQGDIFSSPVMIGGRIFVGCRDDNLYCIDLDVDQPETRIENSSIP